MNRQVRARTPERLRAFFEENPRLALAFSGGCDSAYLLCAASACGAELGVYYVRTAFQPAFELEDEVVVEDYIKGREFSVSVIDGKALPVIEISPLQGFYDYKNKYTPGAAIETCPANLTHKQTEKMQRLAEEGFRALSLDAYGRLDFMMNENGDMFCLEANTLPGMTPTSLMPQEAAQVGMDFPTLCEELIRVSLKKYKGNTL